MISHHTNKKSPRGVTRSIAREGLTKLRGPDAASDSKCYHRGPHRRRASPLLGLEQETR